MRYLDQLFFFDLDRDPGERSALREDPTGGMLTALLADYASAADSGWHLKVMALTRDEMRVSGTIRTDGRIANPSRYFSEIMGTRLGRGSARFEAFHVGADGAELQIDLTVSAIRGEVAFQTDPPDASVTFDLEVSGGGPAAGLFLGRDEPVSSGESITLTRSDPRIQDGPPVNAGPGCYIRAVVAPEETAPPVELTEEQRERLRALGYVHSDTH